MTIPVWPTSLPNLEIGGLVMSGADSLLRTSMDAGPAKQRRRYTAGPRPVSGRVTLDATQRDAFLTWYADSLLDGSLRFEWTDPLTETTAEFRFVGPYEVTKRGARLYIFELPLEILP